MNFVYDDGGRKGTGYVGQARDCVVRSIAIATSKPYKEVYDALNQLAKRERPRKRSTRSSSRNGVYRRTYERYLFALGWAWQPTMFIGQGCKIHLCAPELPSGVLIIRVSKHTTCVIDGTIHDTSDPSRDGRRCVYGYYYKPIQIVL